MFNDKQERELRQSEKKYRQLFEISPAAIFLEDLKGNVVFSNERARRLYGFSKKEAQGLALKSIVPPDLVKNYRLLIKNLRKKGSLTFESRARKKNGHIFPCSLSVGLVKLGGEEYVQAVVADITELKRMEKNLRESEEKSRAVLENSDSFIYMVSKDYKIELMNDSFWKRFGSKSGSKSGAIGDFCYRMIAGLSHPCPDCNNELVFQGKSLHFEKTLSDGSIFEVYNSPVYHSDGRVSKVSISHDITERKRMEEELFNARKLKSVGVLAGGIAHDFNNILTAILGNVSMLKLDAEVGSETYQILSRAESACIRAQGLTRQLLTFSSGGAPLKKTISIRDLLQEAAGFALHGSNVKCRFKINRDLWPVEADPDQVEQVISNLVINANQAMAEGGEMEIRAENAELKKGEIASLPEGRYVKIEVVDEGVGIPTEHLGRIFDPYFTTKQKGSGLGLATAYSIMEKHKGAIRVASKAGEGTTFTIYFPASGKKAERDRVGEGIIPGEGRVLVMDDEESIRNLLSRFLKQLGYEVATAATGEEAVEKYVKGKKAGRPFQAVILDLTVPGGMGGKEAIIKLREIDPAVRAIVSSGYSTAPVMSEYRRAGFSGFIAKPYKVEDMSRVLDRVIRNKFKG